jgi:hypothetical protein
MLRKTVFPLFLVLTIQVHLAQGRNSVIPGEFIVEPPTLICLGFEWKIQGDDNHNATVDVEYRKTGKSEWQEALPMLRIGGEKVWRSKENLEYWTLHMFAGSILDLEQNTEYECRFTMNDPDGVEGKQTKQVTVSTRKEPTTYKGGRVLHVYPPGYEGERQEPSFPGLMQAYYGAGLGDWDVVWERPVQPGDIIEIHGGLYKSDMQDYVTPLAIPFHGTYVLTIDGTPEKPIVIRAAGDGEVIFDGNGCYRLFDVMAADYNYFQGLTIRNTDIAFYAGYKDVLGCSGLVVQNCRLEDVGIGINAQYAGSKNFYIADNVMIGRDDPYRIIGWANPGVYGATPVKSYYGVKVYGQGHVICHNHISFFHDGICICTHGSPESDPDLKSVAIDIYNNEIRTSVDDFIETDGGTHNIRVLRNRGLNASHYGLSAQPLFGGPVYFVRNVVYNVPRGGALKVGGANPAGLLIYHNTFIAENHNTIGCSNVHYRNNLFMGTDRPGKHVLRTLTYTSYSSLDYNGYRPNENGRPQFMWNAPTVPDLRNYDLTIASLIPFETLAEFQQNTGHEEHGILVDYSIFENVKKIDPDQPHKVYVLGDMDFRLKPGSKAVDAGCVLPNINDDFTGQAPDLGALERERAIPLYGPRK